MKLYGTNLCETALTADFARTDGKLEIWKWNRSNRPFVNKRIKWIS